MLTIYRRHLAACKFRHLGRKHRNCQCPIWTAGVLHGRKIKKSLDLHSWEAAQKLVREAIEIERQFEPDDVWVDDDWKKDPKNVLSSAIGFVAYSQEEDDQ